MDDKVLLNISLIVAVIGIVALLILSFYDKIPEKDFNDIRCEDAGKYVKVSGKVISMTLRNTSMSIRLKQECTQDIFMFDINNNISINDTITIQGTVQEYNGKLSILADRITVKG